MPTVDDLMKQAWAAILRGDYAERDRLCDEAKILIEAEERQRADRPDGDDDDGT